MRVALVGAELEENLATRYILGALQARGHQGRMIVFNGPEDLERAAGELAASGARVAGLSMVFTHRAREFARLAARAREVGFRGHLTAGGHFATFNAERLLGEVPALDSVVCGEGETLLCELVEHLEDPAGVRGLVWREATGTVRRNPPAVTPADLDSLPGPARMPFDTYLDLPIVNMLSSRGCSHACAFCSISAWHRHCGGERYRQRHPRKVAEEMADLHRQGVRIFNFHDDNFLPREPERRRERVAALGRELGRLGLGRIAFAIKARPDSLEPETLAALQEMGLFRVFVGIEAGTEESLRHLGRAQRLEDNVQALELTERLGIHACFNLLLLNPDSTLEDLAGNVAFLRAHPHHPMNFCRTEVYAGTPLEARLRRQGRLRGDFWGQSYRITDPRAQRAFELTLAVFHRRARADDCLHHLVMRADYEQQLLGHFLGIDPDLRRRVKEYIRRVNGNTCDHLEAVVALAGRDLAPRERADPVEELRRQVAEDDERLQTAGEALVAEIRRAAWLARRSGRGVWLQRTAAAGVAAALTLGSGGCGERVGTHPTEMAAPPVEKPTPPPETAPTGNEEHPGTQVFERAPVPVEPSGPTQPFERAPVPPEEDEPEPPGDKPE